MLVVMTETATAPLLTGERHKFAIDDEHAYFNTAAVSPLLHSVREAAQRALDQRANPWQFAASSWYTDVDELRGRAARLFGVAVDNMALIPATSYGMATVARNLDAGPGDRVLVLDQEFPSNIYSWQRFATRTGADMLVVRQEPGQSWTEAILAALDERVKIASIPNVHWTNGALVDLERVSDALHALGARFVIDGSQSVGAMPLDIARLRPDAVVTVGYKWQLGPYSLGYMYLDDSLLDGEPLEENWIARVGSEDFGALVDYNSEYRPGAERYDVGERTNFQLTPMANAALQQLLDWGVQRIAATLRVRTDQIAEGAEGLGLSVPPRDQRAPHMLGVGLPREAAARMAASLGEAGVVASVRGLSVRIAPHLHVDDGDVDRLLEALGRAL
jgi:selenocysteine lyase/cysteine desulfurase